MRCGHCAKFNLDPPDGPPLPRARRVKVARLITRAGALSVAEELPVSAGEIRFPAADGNDAWVIYVPLHGLEFTEDAAFYHYMQILESEVEGLRSDRRLVINYLDSDLLPVLSPKEEERIWQEAVREVLEQDEHESNGKVYARPEVPAGGARFIFPELPEGACHQEVVGVGIVEATEECQHVAHKEPQPNGGTDSNPDLAYSSHGYNLYPLDFIPESPVGVLSEFDPDVHVVAGDTWVCTNHPPGFEISYPATTEACEVCGRGRDD